MEENNRAGQLTQFVLDHPQLLELGAFPDIPRQGLELVERQDDLVQVLQSLDGLWEVHKLVVGGGEHRQGFTIQHGLRKLCQVVVAEVEELKLRRSEQKVVG